jgi:hypothetical protein
MIPKKWEPVFGYHAEKTSMITKDEANITPEQYATASYRFDYSYFTLPRGLRQALPHFRSAVCRRNQA